MNRTIRRGIVVFLAVVAVCAMPALLFAGGSQEQKAGAASGANGNWGNVNWQQFKGKTLNVLITSMPVAEVYKKQIAAFEALTGMKVNFELLNDTDRRKKQIVDFSSHMGEYDLGNIGFANREEFAQPGYLADLAAYVNNPKLTDAAWYNIGDYPKDIIAAGYSNGKLVYIPFTAEFFLLWYRTDIFKQLNLSPPKTFDDLRATAAKLDAARKAGQISAYAWVDRELPGSSEAGWNLFCTANRMNVDFLNYKAMTSNVATPQGKSVLTFYTSMIKDYAPPGTGNWSWGEIAQAFKSGQIAMTVGGNASYTYLEDPAQSKVAGKVGYAPPPMTAEGRDPLWEWGWGVNADSKNKDAAWLFVEWATSPTLMNQIAPEYGVPARKSVYAAPGFIKAMPGQQFIDAELFMLNQGVNPDPGLINAKYGETADIISKEMSNIIAGIKNVDQAASDADAALSKLGYTPAH